MIHCFLLLIISAKVLNLKEEAGKVRKVNLPGRTVNCVSWGGFSFRSRDGFAKSRSTPLTANMNVSTDNEASNILQNPPFIRRRLLMFYFC